MATKTNAPVTLTDDQALKLTYASVDRDGVPLAGAPLPSLAFTGTDGSDQSALILLGTDSADSASGYITRAPWKTGQPATVAGNLTATYPNGDTETTPISIGPGAAASTDEAASVVSASALPATVSLTAFPAPSAAPAAVAQNAPPANTGAATDATPELQTGNNAGTGDQVGGQGSAQETATVQNESA